MNNIYNTLGISLRLLEFVMVFYRSKFRTEIRIFGFVYESKTRYGKRVWWKLRKDLTPKGIMY